MNHICDITLQHLMDSTMETKAVECVVLYTVQVLSLITVSNGLICH